MFAVMSSISVLLQALKLVTSSYGLLLKNMRNLMQMEMRVFTLERRYMELKVRLANLHPHQRRGRKRRNKRHSKGIEENYWDCSVCTYRNSAEAFKCLMCDVRKGTSTRKPRINPQLVAQQVAQQYTQPQPKPKVPSSTKPEKEKKGTASPDSKATKRIRPRLKNIDRSSAQQKAVTVNNVTVIITEFQPKRRTLSETSTNGPHSSSSGSSTDSGSQSDSASHGGEATRNGDVQTERR